MENDSQNIIIQKQDIFGEVIYSNRSLENKKRSIKNHPSRKFTKKFKIILISSVFLLCLVISGILCYFYLFKKPPSPSEIELENDDLIININYITDILYIYENNKIFKMKGENKDKNNSVIKEQILFADVFFIIRNHIQEKNITANKTKNIYSGYLG